MKYFIEDIFPLGVEKESKYNKITLFWGSSQSLDLSLNT